MKKIVKILGGGTVSHVRSHLALLSVFSCISKEG